MEIRDSFEAFEEVGKCVLRSEHRFLDYRTSICLCCSGVHMGELVTTILSSVPSMMNRDHCGMNNISSLFTSYQVSIRKILPVPDTIYHVAFTPVSISYPDSGYRPSIIDIPVENVVNGSSYSMNVETGFSCMRCDSSFVRWSFRDIYL